VSLLEWCAACIPMWDHLREHDPTTAEICLELARGSKRSDEAIARAVERRGFILGAHSVRYARWRISPPDGLFTRV